MPTEVINEIKELFEKEDYDAIVKMVGTKINFTENNYQSIFNQILNIINNIRKDRKIEKHEELIEKERKFAVYFTGNVLSSFKAAGISEEKLDEVFRACRDFYNNIDSITSIGGAMFSEDEGEKIK